MAKPATRLQAVKSTRRESPVLDREAIAIRAYGIWLSRGCPVGTDQEDWYQAEAELKNEAERAA